MSKVLSVLGSTGSIGTQTLEVVRNNSEDFEVAALACGRSSDILYEQILEFNPSVACLQDESAALELSHRLRSEHPDIKTEILCGSEGLSEAACVTEADTVVGAVVGVAGLKPTYEAILKGKNIALANKETLVAGGDIIMPLVREKKVDLLPVDSEHSAVWQCLWGQNSKPDRILLTASGGPFRGMSREQLGDITPQKALMHPTWNMGGKITIDSATMMNKGLEVLEAGHLFGVGVDSVDVVVHPQSVIHSMVRMSDGSVLAQMGKPSMILPIMIALYYPERGERMLEEFDPFDPRCSNLSFERCDTDVFRLLDLAYEAGRTGGLMPAVMNAANEIAVNAFLNGRIGFLDIEKYVFETYDYFRGREGFGSRQELTRIEQIYDADKQARIITEEFIKG